MFRDQPERGKETVEIVYRYEQWDLGYGTVTREVVADFYDALHLVKVDYDFDDYMGIAMNLKWVGIGEHEGPQILRSQSKLLLPQGWKQAARTERVTVLATLMLKFAG